MPEVERSDPPGQDAARVPIHDGHQIQEPDLGLVVSVVVNIA